MPQVVPSFHPLALLALAGLALSGGCGKTASSEQPGNGDAKPDIALNRLEAPDAAVPLVVRSEAFAEQAAIPLKYSAYGDNISPALSWSGAPENAQSMVLIVEDPDAPTAQPFVHWLLANIPASRSTLPAKLPEGDSLSDIDAQQGKNDAGKTGYFGPRPPADGKVHHYHFQLFALDKKLELPRGFNRQTLLGAMQGHVLAEGQIVGTYKR